MPGQPAKPSPSVEMKKTQPLITMPEPAPRSVPAPRSAPLTAPLPVAPTSMATVIDAIPMSLCWGLLAASAVTLIIQIWNYFT